MSGYSARRLAPSRDQPDMGAIAANDLSDWTALTCLNRRRSTSVLGNLNEISTCVVKHCRCDGPHDGWRLGEPHASSCQPARARDRENHNVTNQPAAAQPPSHTRKAAASPFSAHQSPGKEAAVAISRRAVVLWASPRKSAIRRRLGSPRQRAMMRIMEKAIAASANIVIRQPARRGGRGHCAGVARLGPATSSIRRPAGKRHRARR